MDVDVHTYCQEGMCIYCEALADRKCPHFSKGENDGGKHDYEYEEDEEE